MDFLPQRESSGTKALCALFESKATLQQSFNSSPRLNTGRDCPLLDWRSHNTPLKETTIQVRGFSTCVLILYMTQHDVPSSFNYSDLLSDKFKATRQPL